MLNPQVTGKIKLGVQKRGKVRLPTFNWQIDLAIFQAARDAFASNVCDATHRVWIN